MVLLFREIPQVKPATPINAVIMANKGKIMTRGLVLIAHVEMDIESREINVPKQSLESEVEIDIAEFDYYCTIFEDMLSRLEREEEYETYGI